MAVTKRAISWTATILLVAVLLVFAALGSLILSGYKPEVIVSGSMSPLFERGTLIFAQPKLATELRKGQIITFQNPKKTKGHLVTHRIYEVIQTPVGPEFKTKGDANSYIDPWTVRIQKDAGRYAFSIPYVGQLSFLIGSTIGYILLFALPILLLMSFALFKIWSTAAPEDDEPLSMPDSAAIPEAPVFGYPREV